MRYQYKREPLTTDEANRIANACQTHEEKLVVWNLLDSGLRVSEFSTLAKDNIQWQEKRFSILGKGGPYGKKTKRRISPMSDRVYALFSHHFAHKDNIGISRRTAQRITN